MPGLKWPEDERKRTRQMMEARRQRETAYRLARKTIENMYNAEMKVKINATEVVFCIYDVQGECVEFNFERVRD